MTIKDAFLCGNKLVIIALEDADSDSRIDAYDSIQWSIVF